MRGSEEPREREVGRGLQDLRESRDRLGSRDCRVSLGPWGRGEARE